MGRINKFQRKTWLGFFFLFIEKIFSMTLPRVNKAMSHREKESWRKLIPLSQCPAHTHLELFHWVAVHLISPLSVYHWSRPDLPTISVNSFWAQLQWGQASICPPEKSSSIISPLPYGWLHLPVHRVLHLDICLYHRVAVKIGAAKYAEQENCCMYALRIIAG